jgi:hypothetical protein
MATREAGVLTRRMQAALAARDNDRHSDGELMRRFLRIRDEAAF